MYYKSYEFQEVEPKDKSCIEFCQAIFQVIIPEKVALQTWNSALRINSLYLNAVHWKRNRPQISMS